MKTIENYPNYVIYEDGRVQNIKTGRFLKTRVSTNGYILVDLCNLGIQKCLQIHRILAEAFISNPDNKSQVNHKDGNKQNNSLSNLEWSTRSENIQHAWDTGLKALTDIQRNTMRLNGLKKAKLFHWSHPEYGKFFCSATDLIRKFPEQRLDLGALSKVSRKIHHQHKDWIITFT